MEQERLRILPFYTGDMTLDEVLKNPKSVRLLWLEILLNGEIPWENYLHQPEVKAAYEKACLWYGHFKTMIEGHTGRRPLDARRGKIDPREYRRFLEVLNFVSGRS
jgi:hypothetical protein